MISRKIPRWHQCGIFSIRPWWALFLFFTLYGQPPQFALRIPATRPLAAPAWQTDSLTILALRVAFTPDENLSTTGDGTFLMDIDSLDINPVPCAGFLVDRPPHNALYFYAQLQAMANYYRQVSRGRVTFDLDSSLVYPPAGTPPIELQKRMASYSYRPVADEDSSDVLLVQLFAESLQAAAVDSLVNPWEYDLVVVFHAGLGQDFAYPFLDPTPRDIPSATVDSNMVLAALGTPGILLPDSTLFDRPGILLPEGQNHIYYGIVEDIFPGQTDYCDVQIGLTGTFALLVGSALGFPPLYVTDDFETGVGVFGLMDVGSNNGQGVIPAPPTAWTRTHLDWEDAVELEGDIALAARHLSQGQIGRITLSTDEYFLVENRVNWIPGLTGVDMDSLRYRDRTELPDGGYILPHYFDYLVDLEGVDTSNGVITAIPNYDLGLPGSGLLIWHVDESRYNIPLQGINDNTQARAVALEEADGAVDIGFPTTAVFADPTRGWRWDMWYAGNEAFFGANRNHPKVDYPFLIFDSETHPSTHLNSGAKSGIAVLGIGPAGETLSFVVTDEQDVTRLPEGSCLLGFNGEQWIYTTVDFLGLVDSLWLGDRAIGNKSRIAPLTFMASEFDPVIGPTSNSFWVIEAIPENYPLWHSPRPWYSARRFTEAGILAVEISDTVKIEGASFNEGLLVLQQPSLALPPSPDSAYIRYISTPDNRDDRRAELYRGYLHNTIHRSVAVLLWAPDIAEPSMYTYVFGDSNDALALGDIDGDGLDEIVSADFSKCLKAVSVLEEELFAEFGIAVDGFPVTGDFSGPILIANLMDDIRPELVVVESGDIAIYSPEGQPLTRLGLHAEPDDLFLMHFFADSLVGLANGDRIHWFNLDPEDQNPHWVTPQGRHSRSRVSLNDGTVKVPQFAVLDKSRVYNYPNPVTKGVTRIRFFTGTATKATIRIYTVDGLLVKKKELTNLAVNDYNEWRWVVGDNPSGLYYAVVEVEGADNVSALVKIAVVR